MEQFLKYLDSLPDTCEAKTALMNLLAIIKNEVKTETEFGKALTKLLEIASGNGDLYAQTSQQDRMLATATIREVLRNLKS